MAYGHKAFRKIQVSNPEDTVGTAEAAVEILYGTISQRYADEVWHQPDHDRGVLAKHVEGQFKVGKEVELDFEGELNSRHIVWMISNAVRGNITPTQPDVGNEPLHYLWTVEPGLTAANTPDITNGIDTFTIEYGDNVQAYEAEYLFTKQLVISGTPNEPCEVQWQTGGRQVAEASFTGALAATSPQYFPFNLAKFYVDTSYAGIGGTQKTGMLRAFTWTFDTMFTPRYAADGNFYFSALNEDKKAVSLEITLYRDSTETEALKDLYEAGSPTYLRVELLGETEMDASQANPPYVRLDGAFQINEWPDVDEEDGSAVITLNLESIYDATASKQFGVLIGTTLAAYPA